LFGRYAIEATPEAHLNDVDNWTTADPGLQYFLGDATMSNLFEGLDEGLGPGFPSISEVQYFGYVPGNLYNTPGT
jgi:hypothetical protein